MTDISALCQELQTTWHNEIPLSKAMDMTLDSFADQVLTTRASLAPNVNVHGTAFAGSLYAAQALTGWGMVWLQLKLGGHDADIVIASGQIGYAKPVREDLRITCDFGEHTEAMVRLRDSGKTRFTLTTEVHTDDGIACSFSGEYAVRLRR